MHTNIVTELALLNVLILLKYTQFNELPDDDCLELKHVAGIPGI